MATTKITSSVISDEFQTAHSLTAGATVDLDFNSAQVFTLVPNQNTTFTFSDFAIGMVKILRINGTGASKTLTFPGTSFLIAGAYDDTANVKNFIQIICTNDTNTGEFFHTISQPS